MIYSLTGKLLEKTPAMAVIDCGGRGAVRAPTLGLRSKQVEPAAAEQSAKREWDARQSV